MIILFSNERRMNLFSISFHSQSRIASNWKLSSSDTKVNSFPILQHSISMKRITRVVQSFPKYCPHSPQLYLSQFVFYILFHFFLQYFFLKIYLTQLKNYILDYLKWQITPYCRNADSVVVCHINLI